MRMHCIVTQAYATMVKGTRAWNVNLKTLLVHSMCKYVPIL